MEKEYLELVRQLIEQRGVGETITRKELVTEMIVQYKPGVSHKINSTIRICADVCLRRLRLNGFLESVCRGKNRILKKIPALPYLEFVEKYPI